MNAMRWQSIAPAEQMTLSGAVDWSKMAAPRLVGSSGRCSVYSLLCLCLWLPSATCVVGRPVGHVSGIGDHVIVWMNNMNMNHSHNAVVCINVHICARNMSISIWVCLRLSILASHMIRAERFGEIIELRLFQPILRFSMRLFIFSSSLCSVLFTNQAVNHSVVWPTQHWKQSTCKLLFPFGQAYEMNWCMNWYSNIFI